MVGVQACSIRKRYAGAGFVWSYEGGGLVSLDSPQRPAGLWDYILVIFKY